MSRLQEQISGVDKLAESKHKYIESIEEEIAELVVLYEEKLVDKVKLRETKRMALSLESEIAQYKTDKASLNVQISEAEEENLLIIKEFMNSVLDELQEVSASLYDLNEKIIPIKDMIQRTVVKAPISGIVDNLQVFNNEGVIKPGSVIMNIVPKNIKLIVQSQLTINDIDQVHVGQLSDIRFSAFDTQTTFVVEGIVRYISADRKVDEADGAPYYQVDIDFTDNGKKQIIENQFILKAGMPAEVMIKTGSRTMLSYVIQPFIDMKTRAFNED